MKAPRLFKGGRDPSGQGMMSMINFIYSNIIHFIFNSNPPGAIILPMYLYFVYVVNAGLPAAAGAENFVSTNTFCIPSSFFSNL